VSKVSLLMCSQFRRGELQWIGATSKLAILHVVSELDGSKCVLTAEIAPSWDPNIKDVTVSAQVILNSEAKLNDDDAALVVEKSFSINMEASHAAFYSAQPHCNSVSPNYQCEFKISFSGPHVGGAPTASLKNMWCDDRSTLTTNDVSVRAGRAVFQVSAANRKAVHTYCHVSSQLTFTLPNGQPDTLDVGETILELPEAPPVAVTPPT
jgi:hypothetical protein